MLLAAHGDAEADILIKIPPHRYHERDTYDSCVPISIDHAHACSHNFRNAGTWNRSKPFCIQNTLKQLICFSNRIAQSCGIFQAHAFAPSFVLFLENSTTPGNLCLRAHRFEVYRKWASRYLYMFVVPELNAHSEQRRATSRHTIYRLEHWRDHFLNAQIKKTFWQSSHAVQRTVESTAKFITNASTVHG